VRPDAAERSSAGYKPKGLLDSAERSSAGDEQQSLNNVERSSAGYKPEGLVAEGWAYFANSYRLSEAPAGFSASWAEYGDRFVAALELEGDGRRLLLCQFHPELSGPWGLELIRAWLGIAPEPYGGAS